MTDAVHDGAGRHGAPGPAVSYLIVLYDAGCPLCRAARRWLETREHLVPLQCVAAGSARARQLLPGLDHDATSSDVTVVADTGEIYTGDGAWLACLWALAGYRELAGRLAEPHLLPAARRVIAAAAAVRSATRKGESTTTGGYGDGDERQECADDRCHWP